MRVIIPQKARGKFLQHMWTDPEWVAEVKEDGDRRIAQFTGIGPRFTGTPSKASGKPVEKTRNLPHLNGYMGDSNRDLIGTVLDGEIIAPWGANLPGGKSKYVTTIMGSGSAIEAIRKQQHHGWLKYVVFDCLFYKGKDIRGHNLVARQIAIDQALVQWGNPHAMRVASREDGNKEEFYDKVVKAGGEGVILKHKKHTYGNERLWVKVKKWWTGDVVLIGFKPGKGKYLGGIGAMIFGQYRDGKMWTCGACSGFDDDLREGLSKRDFGRAVKIKHWGREPTGAFRHPQFLDWREDKRAKDCVYNPEEV